MPSETRFMVGDEIIGSTPISFTNPMPEGVRRHKYINNMAEDNSGYEVVQVQPVEAEVLSLASAERAEVDIQVSTAHRYPRNITRCINNSIAIATLDLETAQSCGYALPRGGKPITGPSIHLARIIAQNYGNMRADSKVVQITDRQVVSRGVAWDLENNFAVAFEVRRSIVYSNGNRFSDDMITVTGNAANAIAFRNAVFAVVPKGITDNVYKAAQRAITGDLSDEDKLIKRRNGAIQHFYDTYGITEEEVIKLCGKQTVNQIKADEIALLLGIAQSLKDGDATVEDIMRPIRDSKEAKKDALAGIARKAAQRKAKSDSEAPSTESVDTETGEVKTEAKAEEIESPNPQP